MMLKGDSQFTRRKQPFVQTDPEKGWEKTKDKGVGKGLGKRVSHGAAHTMHGVRCFYSLVIYRRSFKGREKMQVGGE